MENEHRVGHIYISHRINAKAPNYYVYYCEITQEKQENGEISFRNQIPLIIAKRDTYGEAVKFLEERLEGKEYLKVYNDDAYYLTDTK